MTAAMMRVHGHFGEILQGRLGPEGPVALVTCPCPAFWAEAEVRAGGFGIHGSKAVGRQRLGALCDALGLARRGRVLLRTTMPPGGGAGASTAGLLAIAGALGAAEHPDLMAILRRIEGASDPLIFARPERVLWASREARVLRHLGPLPRFAVVGGFWGQGQRTDAKDAGFSDVRDLVAELEGADIGRLAAIASEAARRTLALRGPADDPMEDLLRDTGAIGFLIAHTGSARGLIFAPETDTGRALVSLRAAGFSRITRFNAGG